MKKSISILDKRVIIALIIIVGAVIIASGYLYYYYEESRVKAEVKTDLEAIALLKSNQISTWFADELSDAKTISGNFFLVKELKKWNVSKSQASRSEILNYCEDIIEEHDLKNILVVSSDGNLMLSVDSTFDEIEPVVARTVRRALRGRRPYSTDLYINSKDGTINIDFVSPVIDRTNNIVAILVLQEDAGSFFFPLISERPIPNKTFETIVARRQNDSVLVLNKLQSADFKPLGAIFQINRTDIQIVKATLGYEGDIEGKDYSGQDVFAYANHIPGTDWFMLNKISQSELVANLSYRARAIIVITVLLIFLVAVSFFLVYNFNKKKIYKALLDTQKQFRTTLYSIGDAVITTDNTGVVKILNSAAEQLTGWTEAEAVDKKIEEVFNIIDENTHSIIENPVSKVLKEGRLVSLANHSLLISKSGEARPIADSGAPIKNETGEVLGVVLVFRDQTDERQKQKTILENEEKFRNLFENSPIGESIAGLDGTMRYNKAFSSMLGYTKEELSGKNWREITHHDDLKISTDISDALLKNEIEHGRFRKRYIHKDGSIIWTEISTTLQKDSDSKPLYYISSVIDITKQKEAEEEINNHKNHLEELVKARTEALNSVNKELLNEIELRKNTEKLLEDALGKERELNTMKSRFISTASHEFRTPLTSILSSVELVERFFDRWDRETIAKHFERIKTAVYGLSKIIDNVLMISRSEAGKTHFKPEKIKLSELCEAAMNIFESVDRGKHELIFNYDAPEDEYLVDKKQIELILHNIISNAIKYSPMGGVVQLSVSESGNILLIKISDHGIGIPEADLPKIFEEFHRADNTGQISGTGLGLSIVKNAVNLHDGRIDIQSEEGKGTEISIRIPARK